MKCKVETIPPYRIAYMRRVGPYGPANVEVMEELKKWAKEKQLLESAILFAIPQDNPQTTAPESCRFDACIVLSANYQLDDADSICEGELAGGNYLVFEAKHTAEDIQRAYAEIFPALHSKGYTMDSKPILEKYTGDITTNPYCEICVPVTAL
ncbi:MULTISPECIES: GyrI-like domain-containing protein [Brevibacillus]|jgi:DNA gyrase inhibitor|uniref:AraC family transcriptional regulator n=1 Tax=Brevibacillus TaxID=55080 RepID=UPI00156B73F2|nr:MULTISPECIES: GyrI-like domain-containing protein [Brevibacillus]MBU8715319.1 GyrI-like domain-containing protein [Brevibacillus parabrevis]MDH6352011.1 DNA gyrase inhibitor [Brevibacillus sp. 1238]MDR4999746.1 GyrI-like domain-containing protein [Brevibacillus parabrevis]MED2257076.1 GyrI-like domain-containing protein [Brevibacillus parabrevis]UED69740.1 GyrI-like domain-containing protein [Brevibacillus sp. HD3.3A]